MLNINISKNIYPEVKRAKEIGQNWCYTFANGGRTGKNIGMKTYNIKTCTAFAPRSRAALMTSLSILINTL